MSAAHDIRRELLVASYAIDKAAEKSAEAPEDIRRRVNQLRRDAETLTADVAMWIES